MHHMNGKRPPTHLSHISTLWTLVLQAHQGPPDAAGAAQRSLLERYAGAVHRYLRGALHDDEAADELFQDFCIRFLGGDFKHADPERGRFRDYVKTALFHLVVDYRKRQQAQPWPLAGGRPEPFVLPLPTDAERAFVESWREELLDRTWKVLDDFESRTGQPYHTLLRVRTEQPLLSSEELAGQLAPRLGKAYSIDGVRKALQRARDKFTDLLLEEVIQSLGQPGSEDLESELVDLGLFSYCRAALQRRASGLRP
jgi:RNA polymerase sigma-70 factor (ECF subfamily)